MVSLPVECWQTQRDDNSNRTVLDRTVQCQDAKNAKRKKNQRELDVFFKGAHTIATGISDAVAETIIDLGIDWSSIETLTNLQTGLRAALTALGFEMVQRSNL